MQAVDPLPDGQLAAFAMAGDGAIVAAGAAARDLGLAIAQVRDERGHRVVVGARVGRVWIQPTAQDGHGPMIGAVPSRSGLAGSSHPPPSRDAHPVGTVAHRARGYVWPGAPSDARRRPPDGNRAIGRAACGAAGRARWPVPPASRGNRSRPSLVPRACLPSSRLPLLVVALARHPGRGGLLGGRDLVPAPGGSAGRWSPSRLAAANAWTDRAARRSSSTRDGTVHQTLPTEAELGTVPADVLTALDAAVKTTDFDVIRAVPFDGECPVNFDGQEFIYEFGAPGGVERVASCETAIDPAHPVFAATTAALVAVDVIPAP